MDYKLVARAICAALLANCVFFGKALSAQDDKPEAKTPTTGPSPVGAPADSTTEGQVTAGSTKIEYSAVAGTLTVGSSDGDDAKLGLDGKILPELNEKDPEKPADAPATARMFYAAYFKKNASADQRPVTFIYNGGPGSATIWLHIGAFGPQRVSTTDTEHEPGAPYKVIDNGFSLLDASDLVFIDAPGTGFSRIFGKDKETQFYGVDQDAHAFERFIRRFLTKFGRWNSPKYLLGESYGGTRSAVLASSLQNVDLNGIMLLSPTLCYDHDIDGPQWNPGIDYPYALMLPTLAATACYHHKLDKQPAALEPFLAEVEEYALGDYLHALVLGSEISDGQKDAVAKKLHEYTGLPVAYLLKCNLRVTGGMFRKNLLADDGLTIGRFDSRYKGPDLDPTSSTGEYDPQSNAIDAPYTAAMNHYLRSVLKTGQNETYLPEIGMTWDFRHGFDALPNGPKREDQAAGGSVLPDLAHAMKSNPRMHILIATGYYDLAIPFFAAPYEMHHLPIPKKLQSNVVYCYYPTGHMPYVNPEELKRLHDDFAAFISRTWVSN
jgi:carboxypeptidase C (cathepsin A)